MHQYSSFLIMAHQDMQRLMRTESPVEISVTMSKAMTIEEMTIKLQTDPKTIKIPLVIYSLASIARGLLGTNMSLSRAILARISFAFM